MKLKKATSGNSKTPLELKLFGSGDHQISNFSVSKDDDLDRDDSQSFFRK